MSPELLITLRHFKSKKRNIFISVLTFISILGVLIAVFSLISVNSVTRGFEMEIKEKVIENEPHVMIHAKAEDVTDKDFDNVMKKIKNIPDISVMTKYISSTVLISSSSNLNAVKLTGVDPKAAKKNYGIFRTLKTGKMSYIDNPKQAYVDLQRRLNKAFIQERERQLALTKDKKEQEEIKEEIKFLINRKFHSKNLACLYIGDALADSLHLRTGEELKIITPFGDIGPTGLMPKSRKFRICGTFFTTLYEFDLHHIYMPIKDAKKFLGITNVTGVEIKIKDIYKSDKVVKKIEKIIDTKRFSVSGFSKMNKNLFSALQIEKKGMFLLLFLIMLVSSFNIVATLTLIVNSKKKEIAILKSLGFTKNRIRKIFMFKGFIIGIIGIILGTITGLSATYFLSKYTMNADVYYIQKLPVRVNPSEVIIIVLITIVITLLATIIPASRAANITPVYGLKGK